jgi:hypothetical protein
MCGCAECLYWGAQMEKAKDISTYIFGKWWPELGNYAEWEKRKLGEAGKDFVITKVDRCSTYTGGITLLVDGYHIEPLDIDKSIDTDTDFAEHKI